jgi:hypothetical protein
MRNETLFAVEPLISDHRVFILLGDLGVFQCQELFSKYPENILNYGIMEQSMLGTAAGLSSAGMYPIVYSIAPFLVDRAYEQIKLDLVYNRNPCLLISAGASYDYAKLGPTHYCPHDISSLLLIGYPTIYTPFTVDDCLRALNYSVGQRTLSYLRLSSSTLSMSVYSWLTSDNSIAVPNISTFSHPVPSFRLWRSSHNHDRALVLFSPDSQYLPCYEILINHKTDVVCVSQISDSSLAELSVLASSYNELDILAPFESSALMERIYHLPLFRPCRLNVHTITNMYFDHSSTKKETFPKLYKHYSVDLS